MKKNLLQFAALLIVVALVAASSCLLTSHFVGAKETRETPHNWVHEQLGITPEQEKLLEPIEARYEERRRHSEEMMRIANRELAQAILEDKGNSARTDQAIEHIHHAMGELQKATLNHIFEMKAVLKPDQYEKLLRLTADGLHEISGE